MTPWRSIWRDERGSSAFEFVLVVPLLALFIFGVIDAGMFAWRINVAEKAAQVGVRMAVVTDPVASALATEDYVGKTVGTTTLQQGDVIPAAALGVLQCTSSACTCATAPCTALTRNSAAFDRIVAQMRKYDPSIQAANVTVEYRGSGLGFAGDPGGMQIAPLTTVKVTGLSYSSVALFLFKTAIPLPNFSSSLTMEDGAGANSN